MLAYRCLIGGLLLALLVAPAAGRDDGPEVWPAPRYSVKEAPSAPPGMSVVLTSINAAGHMAGCWLTPGTSSPTRAIVWDGERVRELPTQLPGADGQASAINDRGQVIGWELVQEGNGRHSSACLWTATGVTDLGSLVPGGVGAMAINSAGQVVLNSHDFRGPRDDNDWRARTLAFLWSGGRLEALDPLREGKVSYGSGINDRGEVCGGSGTLDGNVHAVVWKNGRITDLGTLGELRNSRATAINDRGEVVGTASGKVVIERKVEEKPGGGRRVSTRTTGGRPGRAFRWLDGKMTDLGDLGGDVVLPYDINNQGQIVGEVQFPQGRPRAFLWENGKLLDLNALVPPSPGRNIDVAHSINDRGQIVAYAVDKRGGHALLLTPLAAREDE